MADLNLLFDIVQHMNEPDFVLRVQRIGHVAPDVMCKAHMHNRYRRHSDETDEELAASIVEAVADVNRFGIVEAAVLAGKCELCKAAMWNSVARMDLVERQDG